MTPDFVETTEDLSGSPLWNADLAPTPLSRRTWSTYHIAALWIGMSVVITTYTLASGLMQQGMLWWPAILRALVACGWFGIQTWIGALALNTLLAAAVPAWAGLAGNIWISFAIF